MSILALLPALLAMSAPTVQKPARDLSVDQQGDFLAKMMVVPDLNAFWAVWEKPEPPNVETTSQIGIGERVSAIVIFAGCKAAANGKCNVSVSYSMIDEDGAPYGSASTTPGKAWTEAPAPGHNLLASLSAMTFELERKDKLGTYRITAKLTDEVAHKTLTVSQPVTAKTN